MTLQMTPAVEALWLSYTEARMPVICEQFDVVYRGGLVAA